MDARFIKLAVYSILVLFFIGIAIFTYQSYVMLTKPLIPFGQAPRILEVKPNATAHSLIDTLYAEKLISERPFYQGFIRYRGLANHLKAGVYQITPGESAQKLFYKIVRGEVISQSFPIIAGTNIRQISTQLQHAPFLTYSPDDWLAITDNHLDAEGLLLADTYHYDGGSGAKRLLQTANKALLVFLEYSWQNRSPNLAFKTSYEMLIVASIIEKETAIPSERKIIAGVIVNRLHKNMPLQMDPTVIYALSTNFSGKLSHDDLTINSPYNTYRYRGLPPTPIAMVGKDAIEAAAHPQISKYIYYVAKGDGSHVFSETYDEQRKAISRYLNKGS